MVVKVLVCGDVGGNFELLLTRVATLQSSAHGPFDVLLFSGKLFDSAEEFGRVAPTLRFPLQAYAFDRTGVADDVLPSDSNLEFFNAYGAGLATVCGLTVAFLSPFADTESVQDAKDIACLPGYRGCDVLLTADWPRETHHFLEEADLAALRATGVGLGIGLQAVADFALAVRPRYHFAATRGAFYQRPPYRNPPHVNAAGQAQPSPCTRFVGLGRVSTSKDKERKWLHALSLEPIVHMRGEDVALVPVGTTDCPYASVASAPTTTLLRPPMPPGQPPTKRMRTDLPLGGGAGAGGGAAPTGASSGSFFFGNRGLNRDGTRVGHSLEPPNATAKTLFIGGIGALTGPELFCALADVADVRVVEGKGFAFCAFATQAAARRVIEGSTKQPLVIGGRSVTVGWAKDKDGGARGGAAPSSSSSSSARTYGDGGGGGRGDAPLDLEPPSPDSTALFVGNLSPMTANDALLSALPGAVAVRRVPGKSFAFVDFADHASAQAVVRQSVSDMVLVDGRVLLVGWAKATDKDREGERERALDAARAEMLLEPPSADSTLLFVGNVAMGTAHAALEAAFPGAVEVRRVPGKSYAFVNYPDFAAADGAVKRATAEPMLVDGRALMVGWAKGRDEEREREREAEAEARRARAAQPPEPDAATVFVGRLPPGTTSEALAALFQDVVEVRLPAGRDYAFVELASHQAARRAVEDAGGAGVGAGGGLVVNGRAVSIGWARGKPAAPSQTVPDCWFCLGSPSVKTHLVVSVSDHAYLALPRGGLVDAHVLLSPIDCVPSRTHLSADAKHDFARFDAALDGMLRTQRCAALRFERTIRTRSRDHMQQHVVPIPLERVSQALPVFLQQAEAHDLRFHEITDGRDADEVVLSMEGGPYQEYFYICLPTGGGNGGGSGATATTTGVRRFVYVHEGVVTIDDSHGNGRGHGGGQKERFPMQFGTTVAAHVLGRPERANWKNCLQSEEQETALAEAFRTAFEPFDFTLSQ